MSISNKLELIKMFGNKQEDRFEFVHKESSKTGPGDLNIIRDKETGVLYLSHCVLRGLGLTPLLDEDGKPVIQK
jgi:hypothetical protein